MDAKLALRLLSLWAFFGLSALSPLMAQSGHPQHLGISFSNDFLVLHAPTDRYYTNGLNLDWLNPALERNPLNHLLIRAEKASVHRYGLSLRQDIYTPFQKDSPELAAHDRPFASVLALQSAITAVHADKGWMWSSSLELGVLGKPGGGRTVQNGFHNLLENSEVVNGWTNEIRTGPVLNYGISYRHRLWLAPWTWGQMGLRGRIGTLHTDLTPSLEVALGRVRDPFRAFENPLNGKRVHVHAVLGGSVRAIAHDGTLTGALFFPDHRFQGALQTERIQGTVKAGFQFGQPAWSVDFSLFWTSPEFRGGASHAYGNLSLSFWW